RRHLDRRLAAVDEAVEHLWIDRGAVIDAKILVQNVPHRIGSGPVVVGLVARALAGRHDIEAAGSRPVDVLTDQRRLIAPGQTVDDTGGLRFGSEERTDQRVGLDADHDDVLAVRDRRERMTDARRRHAGCLADHLDLGEGDERFHVGGDMGTALLECIAERGGRIGGLIPAGTAQLAAGAADIEVSNRNNVHAAGRARLRQEHRTELTGTDHAYTHRPVCRLAPKQQSMKVHGRVYRQAARNTNVSVVQTPSGAGLPESQTQAGHLCAVLTSSPLPAPNPLERQSSLAADVHSAAPLGATVQRARPVTMRVPGRPRIAPVACPAASAASLAAPVVPLIPSSSLAFESSNQRPSASRKPGWNAGDCGGHGSAWG